MLLLEIMPAGMFGRTRMAIKPFQGNRGKKVALLFKPHILLSQMVLLSERLVLNPYWMEFLEEPRFKKKWLIWGKQTSAASFQALWFVVLVGCRTWKHFFLTCAPVSSTGHERRLIGRQWEGSRGSFTQHTWSLRNCFKKQGPHQSWTGIWVNLNNAPANRDNLRFHAAPTVCFLCSGGKLNSIHLASHFPITFKQKLQGQWFLLDSVLSSYPARLFQSKHIWLQ